MASSTPKYALVTGCSEGGIGSALALSFARSGYHVFATARTLSKIQHFTSVANATLLPLDVTSAESIAACVAAVKEKTQGQGLDVLVNNSGRGYAGPVMDADLEEGKRMFEVNFWGVLAVTQGFGESLVQAQGTVVNISSVSASVYSPYRALYGASKAAVSTVSETLRLELAPFNVRVIAVHAGVLSTRFEQNMAEFRLGPNSLYRPIAKEVEADAMNRNFPPGMASGQFADLVVKEVMKGKSGKLWFGTMAPMVKFAHWLVPTFLFDRMLAQTSGLGTLAKMVRARKT